eukprot:TRINITY_DN121397_c0_g1_i1.p1 TRINITY_DN121397_c0_g1~~TRINITY_DN121397_c0_g1_i1.p1  ORF type:complete len:251 (+),score=83.58 TRINITY_DN121397_c0_g1_i1:158-910(+)
MVVGFATFTKLLACSSAVRLSAALRVGDDTSVDAAAHDADAAGHLPRDEFKASAGGAVSALSGSMQSIEGKEAELKQQLSDLLGMLGGGGGGHSHEEDHHDEEEEHGSQEDHHAGDDSQEAGSQDTMSSRREGAQGEARSRHSSGDDLASNAAQAARKMIDSEVHRHDVELRAEEDTIKKEDRIIAIATAAKKIAETKLETIRNSEQALKQREDEVASILKTGGEDTGREPAEYDSRGGRGGDDPPPMSS